MIFSFYFSLSSFSCVVLFIFCLSHSTHSRVSRHVKWKASFFAFVFFCMFLLIPIQMFCCFFFSFVRVFLYSFWFCSECLLSLISFSFSCRWLLRRRFCRRRRCMILFFLWLFLLLVIVVLAFMFSVSSFPPFVKFCRARQVNEIYVWNVMHGAYRYIRPVKKEQNHHKIVDNNKKNENEIQNKMKERQKKNKQGKTPSSISILLWIRIEQTSAVYVFSTCFSILVCIFLCSVALYISSVFHSTFHHFVLFSLSFFCL